MRKPCKIDGCDRPSAGRGWCQKHWARWRKHGDPMMVKPKVRPFKYGPICAVDECAKPHHANGYCIYHNDRNTRNGHPTAAVKQGRPRKGDTLGYDGARLQVRRLHGNANQHRCVDCGGQASEWSYRGGDPDELTTDPTVRREHPGLHYSADPDYYEPRCKPCHRRMDDSLIRGRDPQTGQWIA